MRPALWIAALALTACSPPGGQTVGAPKAAAPPPRIEPPPRLAPPPSEPPLTLDARGTEPFWLMTVRPDRVTLTRPDREAAGWPTPPMIRKGAMEIWRGEGWSLTVTPGPCSDGMSDVEYRAAAVVQAGDEILKGCAGPAPDQTP